MQGNMTRYLSCDSQASIGTALFQSLAPLSALFPTDKNARILLKPNFNSNMNALTGNTTDLRLIAAVIRYLKEDGYTNITIGEGTNSGFCRNNISVISRLGVDNLARYFGVKCIDFNVSEPVTFMFTHDVRAEVARECVEADFLINLPKLKTHFEAGMSACLKNLIGCLVGQENKKKTHKDLAANIIKLNQFISPHLHIVDAIFSMEGLGPTRGVPIRTDTVLVGTDPYFLDLLAARIASFAWQNIPVLSEAYRQQLVTDELLRQVDSFDLPKQHPAFALPDGGPLARFIHSPKRQKYFLAIRNTPFFNFLCNTKIAGNVLCMTGLRQDVYIDDEMDLKGLILREELCNNCNRCRSYCPVGLELPQDFRSKSAMRNCISCLYCFCVCPIEAISFKGKLGFMAEQVKQYGSVVRRIA